jgi:hypothetical protein
LLSLAPKLDGFPPLHFLYVKVDNEDSSIALVEDNPTEQDLKATMVIINRFFTPLVRSSLVMTFGTYFCFRFAMCWSLFGTYYCFTMHASNMKSESGFLLFVVGYFNSTSYFFSGAKLYTL